MSTRSGSCAGATTRARSRPRLSRLADDPQLLARFRGNARRVAEQHYSLEAVWPRFERVLREAMGSPERQA